MSNYIVESNLSGMSINTLYEPETNHLASSFMVENQNMIMNQIKKMNGVDPFKFEDLFQDVFVSIIDGEKNGDGYNADHSGDGNMISVEEFVFGRLKGYSKNDRYRSDFCDRHVYSKKDTDGTTKSVIFEIHNASCDDSTDQENLSGMQKAYSMAKSYDNEIEQIDYNVSLRQDMMFCIDFDKAVNFGFLNLFRQISKFSNDFDEGIFDGLKKSLEEHDQLKDALHNVLTVAATDKNTFDAVLATI